jgi:hypothetical protein
MADTPPRDCGARDRRDRERVERRILKQSETLRAKSWKSCRNVGLLQHRDLKALTFAR